MHLQKNALLILNLVTAFINAMPAAISQISATELQQAVRQQTCEKIDSLLIVNDSWTEEMLLNGGICLYRNGHPDSAYPLFEKVSQWKGMHWKSAAFWQAKCLALRRSDTAAIRILSQLPPGTLNLRMLSQPEFKHLAAHNPVFQKLLEAQQPRLNIWTSALSLLSLTGFILACIILAGKSKFSTGGRWLALLLFSFSIILTAYITIWSGYAFHFPYLRNTWPFLSMLIGPSIFFYIKTVFREDYTAKELSLHCIVPGITLLFTLPAIAGDFGITIPYGKDFVSIASSGVWLAGQTMAYIFLIHQLCSNEWQVDTNIKKWTQLLFRGFLLYTIAFVSYFLLVSASFFNPQWDYSISLVMGLGILGIGYIGLLQKRIFTSQPIEQFLPAQKYQSSALTEQAGLSIRKKLETILNEQQVFKENELRLDDLASYLDISRHQLSQVINMHYGVNFFELINRYRIEHVKKLLRDPACSHHTIMQIAYEAGFNNKASFHRYFKREIGLTPSAFRIKEENTTT